MCIRDRWNCKYHIVFAPKYRRKVAYGKIKQDIADILSMLCKRKSVKIVEAEICPDHVHMLVEIQMCIRDRSTTQVTVLDQEQENRRIVHVLHYVPVKKCKNLEIVDDIIPLYNLKITMTEEREVEKIYTIPDKQEVPFVQDGKKLEFTLKEIKGHQMTAVCYKN